MKNKFHVVFITARFTPTLCGVGDYTRCLARELVRHGVRVTVVTRKQGCPDSLDGFEIKQPVSRWNIFYLASLKKELESLKPDIIHVEYEPFGYHQSFSLPLFLSHTSIAPVVATVHEVWHAKKLHELRDQHLYSHVKHVIVNDYGREAKLLSLAPEAKSHITRLGVGPNISTPVSLKSATLKNPEGVIEIGYFGFFNKTKCIDILIEAFSKFVKTAKSKSKLVMIGRFEPKTDSYHRELKNLSDQKAPGLVEFTGALEDQEVAKRLSQCAFAVLPFIDGATPRRGSFQACASLGLPILTTKAEIPEFDIVNNVNALTVDPLTAENLCNGLMTLAEDRELRNRLSSGALEFASRFTWAHLADQHLKIYSTIVSA